MIELLFTRHALNLCGETATVYAPSTREEYEKGYDAKFIGHSCREIYLQFKTPYIRDDGLFRISLNRAQHHRLCSYPPLASFYVFHAFTSKEELQEQQIQVPKSKDFLSFYLAIEAHAMPLETNFFHYARSAERKPSNPKFKRENDGNIKSARHEISRKRFCDGASLIGSFKKGKAGWAISSDAEDLFTVKARETPQYPLFPFLLEEGNSGMEKQKDDNFGIAIRLFDGIK